MVLPAEIPKDRVRPESRELGGLANLHTAGKKMEKLCPARQSGAFFRCPGYLLILKRNSEKFRSPPKRRVKGPWVPFLEPYSKNEFELRGP